MRRAKAIITWTQGPVSPFFNNLDTVLIFLPAEALQDLRALVCILAAASSSASESQLHASSLDDDQQAADANETATEDE